MPALRAPPHAQKTCYHFISKIHPWSAAVWDPFIRRNTDCSLWDGGGHPLRNMYKIHPKIPRNPHEIPWYLHEIPRYPQEIGCLLIIGTFCERCNLWQLSLQTAASIPWRWCQKASWPWNQEPGSHMIQEIWRCPKMRVPKMDGSWWTILLKWMIWGYPYFRKPPDGYGMFTYETGPFGG